MSASIASDVERNICLRLIVEVADHAVVVTDAEGRFLFWNQGAAALFGWAPEEVISDENAPGCDEALLFPPEDCAMGETERERARAAREGHAPADRWYVRRDGSHFFGTGTVTALREEINGPVRWFARVLRDSTEQHRQTQQLTADRDREHRVAHTLQCSQLPPLQSNAVDGLRIAALYRPAQPQERVGGDFYDAIRLEDGAVALFVGDASGKGLATASRAAEVRYSLRAFLRENPDPARAVRRVNEVLCRCAHLEEQTPGAVFVTLTLLVIHPHNGLARFVTAGGERPLLLRRGAKEPESIEGGAEIALGILPGVSYTAVTDTLHSGDSLVLFTDGVTDARRDGRFFGTKGIGAILRCYAGIPAEPSVIAKSILAASDAFCANDAADDCCILSVTMP